jgi:hypothetical protein
VRKSGVNGKATATGATFAEYPVALESLTVDQIVQLALTKPTVPATVVPSRNVPICLPSAAAQGFVSTLTQRQLCLSRSGNTVS